MSSNNNSKSRKQRALVLQGGGTLGAYEVGVLKILYQKLATEDKENNKEESDNRMIFDVVAGSSIGAMNGAVLVGQFLKTGSWKEAVKQLENFWTDSNKGLASNPLHGVECPSSWNEDEHWYWKKKLQSIASKELAKRYYSVKQLWNFGAKNMYSAPIIRPDYKFLDSDNTWFVHNNDPLKETIGHFADFPISTSFDKNQPRLLVTSVDISEGETVIFDSYKKADGSRKSEYGSYVNGRHEHVIKYPGILIEHVMASGTLPEFYDPQEIDGRKFWDAGILNNTPFRELLLSHQDYWQNVQHEDKIPDLEVYIVNVHPSKGDIDLTDYDATKDRHNDITYCDRNSHYDEQVLAIQTDFTDMIKELKRTAIRHIPSEEAKKAFKRDYENFLKNTRSKSIDVNTGTNRTFEDLIKNRINLTKVVRIENTDYTNSYFGKTGNLTPEAIQSLIKQGEDDASNVLK
jgi:predicted acylesterase/phospholipase RssA